jgi:poly(A) polymerase
VRHAAVRRAVPLDEERIDPDVQKVVRRLVRAGYEAYLVGGCVRDLLLERTPKDFDVATSARPEQVRELFRNSRVIGRRFRLVHVLFQGGKVIEVATFRRKPHEEESSSLAHDDDPLAEASNLLIRSDNVFGEADEDARRRDFTINGLFYDLESQEILDWVGGLDDVRARVVDTIGDPVVRFREDPVRILRALKFAGRLDLGIRPATYDAMVHCRDALELAARPRLAEEVLRLLRGGEARRTLFLAWETGVLGVLLPELSALLDDSFSEPSPPGARSGRIAQRSAGDRVFRLMEHVDKRSDEGAPLDDTALWTLLLLEPIKEAVEGARDRATAVGEFLEPLIERLAIPRRFADGIRRVVAVLPRILAGKAGRFARTELFALAVDVAEAEVHARGLPSETLRPLRASLAPEPRVPERGAPQRGARGSGRPRQAIPRP